MRFVPFPTPLIEQALQQAHLLIIRVILKQLFKFILNFSLIRQGFVEAAFQRMQRGKTVVLLFQFVKYLPIRHIKEAQSIF